MDLNLVLKGGPFQYFKRWTFHYKMVDLLFVKAVLPNLPNPSGYGPETHGNTSLFGLVGIAYGMTLQLLAIVDNYSALLCKGSLDRED